MCGPVPSELSVVAWRDINNTSLNASREDIVKGTSRINNYTLPFYLPLSSSLQPSELPKCPGPLCASSYNKAYGLEAMWQVLNVIVSGEVATGERAPDLVNSICADVFWVFCTTCLQLDVWSSRTH